MSKVFFFLLFIPVFFFQVACGLIPQSRDVSEVSPLDNFEETSEIIYEAYTKNQDPKAGNWFTSLNSKFPLVVRVEEEAVSILWAVTLDSDINMMGTLPKISENVYTGDIHWISGDASGVDSLTMTFFPEKELMNFDFVTFFEEPIQFSKTQEVLSEDLPLCVEVAEKMLSDSRIFADLHEQNLGDKLSSFMQEAADEVLMTYDFRVYREVDGEMVTIDRVRYDFQNKKVLRYDPVEGEYVDIPNDVLLRFDECRP